MRPPSKGIIAATILLAALLAVEVARLTVASHFAADNPAFALRLAPQDPASLVSMGMIEIGQAAAQGGNPHASTLARFRSAAAADPLASEPFLVSAALAERQGDFRSAKLLLTEARRRNPRSIPALYLLADISIRENAIADALSDMAILSRLIPGASVQLIPSLAAFARTPGADKQLAETLRANPKLKSPLLVALAADPANADLVLTLAGPDSLSLDREAISWKARLINGFVQQGDFTDAYRVWRNFAGLPDNVSPLLYNGEFRQSPAPPPFNWMYSTGNAALVEPAQGRLHIIYYERENSDLARQLLLLQPGSYRLQAGVSDISAAQPLSWVVTCATSGKQFVDSPIGKGAVEFSVPPGCQAQTLALRATSQEAPQDAEVQIGPVRLWRTAP